jgi:hypothetical protein
MRLSVVAVFALLSPTLAAARPITIGAMLGEAQSEAESGLNKGPDEVDGAFVRVGLVPHFAAQLELTRIDSDPSYDVRTVSLLGVLDLSNRLLAGRLVPILIAGGGAAWGSSPNSSGSSGLHLEGGLGLEYRTVAGLVIGVDARLGYRWMQTQAVVPYPGGPANGSNIAPCCDGSPVGVDGGLYNGQYRSVRATLGITF